MNTTKIKILYVLNSSSGGATQGIIELVKQIDKTKFTAYFITPDYPNEYQKSLFDSITENYKIIKMGWWNRDTTKPILKRILSSISINTKTILGLKPIVSISNQIKIWDIDIVHTSTSLTISGALAAKLTGKPHVWHIREPIGKNGLFKFWLPDKILSNIFNYFSHTIVPMSDFVGSLFFKHLPEKSLTKVKVIYDGINIKEFDKTDNSNELRLKMQVNSEELLIGMVGSLSSPWKRHDLFIKSAGILTEKYSNIKFVIFGHQPKINSKLHNQGASYLDKLKILSQNLGLNDKLIWGGFITDIPLIMSSLDILVHTCHTEGFGRIAIEAMAAGKPVVGPDQGGISESVLNNNTGILVSPEHFEEFANATERLINCCNLRKHMGDNGKIRAMSKFSIQKHTSEITKLYQNITDQLKHE